MNKPFLLRKLVMVIRTFSGVCFNPFSASCIFKFSQPEPILFIEQIWENLLLIFSSWLCLINSQFLITKCQILYVLYKEKLVVDNWLALKGLKRYIVEKWIKVLIKHSISQTLSLFLSPCYFFTFVNKFQKYFNLESFSCS